MALIRPYSSTEPSRSYRELLQTTPDLYGNTTAVRRSEVHHGGKIGGDPWSRDKIMSSSSLSRYIRSVTVVELSLRPCTALEHP